MQLLENCDICMQLILAFLLCMTLSKISFLMGNPLAIAIMIVRSPSAPSLERNLVIQSYSRIGLHHLDCSWTAVGNGNPFTLLQNFSS